MISTINDRYLEPSNKKYISLAVLCLSLSSTAFVALALPVAAALLAVEGGILPRDTENRVAFIFNLMQQAQFQVVTCTRTTHMVYISIYPKIFRG